MEGLDHQNLSLFFCGPAMESTDAGTEDREGIRSAPSRPGSAGPGNGTRREPNRPHLIDDRECHSGNPFRGKGKPKGKHMGEKVFPKRVEKAKGRILIDGPAIKTKMTKDEAREARISLVLVVPQ